MPSPTTLEQIAMWAAKTTPEWPATSVTPAIHAIADTIACMVSGATDTAAEHVRTTIHTWSTTNGGATIIGSGRRTPAPFAAFANGTAAHAQDFDDNFLAALTHASAVLVPALLALGEETGASGAEIIDAYLVGLECHAAIGRGVNRSHYLKGFPCHRYGWMHWHSCCLRASVKAGRVADGSRHEPWDLYGRWAERPVRIPCKTLSSWHGCTEWRISGVLCS